MVKLYPLLLGRRLGSQRRLRRSDYEHTSTGLDCISEDDRPSRSPNGELLSSFLASARLLAASLGDDDFLCV